MEKYRLIDMQKAYSKKGVEYYYVVIYISRGSFINDTIRVFISQKFYNYINSHYDDLVDVNVSELFDVQYNSQKKCFEMVEDKSIIA